MNLPKLRTQVHRLSVNKLSEYARNEWVLPPYQRALVWEPAQALRLVESVYDGYPIGALLVWSRWDHPGILLDGQQRLAALTGIRCGTDTPGPQVGWSVLGERWALEPISEDDTLITLRWHQECDSMERVEILMGLKDQYSEEHCKNTLLAIDRVTWAVAPVHVLEEATADQAVEAFRRLNTEGTPFDLDELTRLLRACEANP